MYAEEWHSKYNKVYLSFLKVSLSFCAMEFKMYLLSEILG